MSSFTSKLAAAVLKPKLMVLKDKMDYSEYGGAALFGLKAPVIKAHGSSNDQSIFSAIRQTREMVAKEVIPTISSVMEKRATPIRGGFEMGKLAFLFRAKVHRQLEWVNS